VGRSGEFGEKSVVSLIHCCTRLRWQQGGGMMEAGDRGVHGLKMDRSPHKIIIRRKGEFCVIEL